jgi:hypothetical protein
MATKPVPQRAAQPQKYYTYRPSDPRSHLKIKAGQHPAFAKDLGWYAAPGAAVKPKTQVVVKHTSQNATTPMIETPDQIEARVRKMADETFARQKSTMEEEAAALRKQAEGRQVALQNAYAAAAKANAGMGEGAQAGWEQAAKTLTGLAGATTGGIGDALAADLATQEQALARVGAGGTGFDARSQAPVENYRGGFLPSEFFTRSGAIDREAIANAAQSLNLRGTQEGIAAYQGDVGKIDSDLMSQVRELTSGRSDYESKLREQLLSGRADEIKAIQDQREYEATLSLKKVQIEQAQQKINLQYQEAKSKATTTAQKLAVDQWYKQQNVILSQARNDIAQQRVGIAQQNANTTAAKAAQASLPNGGKPPSASTVSNTVARANKAGEQAFFTAAAKVKARFKGINPPANWDAKTKGDYKQTDAYKQAYAQFMSVASKQYFGTFMYRVISAIGPHLRALDYSQNQIRRAAYAIVSAQIDPPKGYRIPKVG